MADVLTPPLALAAIVVCVAGLAKLRSPAAATRAAGELDVPKPRALVPALAALELTVGGWALVAPGLVPDVALAALYALFAAVSLLLARRRAACGCFGEHETPASPVQSALSGALALACGAAAAWSAHGLGWLGGRSLPVAAVTILGIAAAAYATVLAYTELPTAWSAWTGARID